MYQELPEEVQTSWFSLKIVLMEQFDEGCVMKSIHRLCEEPWQVSDFEASFNMVCCRSIP